LSAARASTANAQRSMGFALLDKALMVLFHVDVRTGAACDEPAHF
jgi:hypothetical protein